MEILEEGVTPPNAFLPFQKNVSVFNLWQHQKRKLALRQEYLEHWNNTVKATGTGRPVDALISPVIPYGGAPPHGFSR